MAWNLVSRVLRLFISYPQSFSVKGSRFHWNLNSEVSFEIWNFRILCSVPTAGLTGGKTAVGPRRPVWPADNLRSDRLVLSIQAALFVSGTSSLNPFLHSSLAIGEERFEWVSFWGVVFILKNRHSPPLLSPFRSFNWYQSRLALFNRS